MKNVLTKEEKFEEAKTLIKLNLEKDITSIQSNLRENNILLSKREIYKIKNSIKQLEYPSDINYLNNIMKLKIELSEGLEYNFCPVKLEYYNQDNNQIEKIIILSCNFQLNLLNDINILFMDGTFNTCPCSFYQIFNVIGYIAKKDIIFPVMVCLVNAKTERIYDNVFNEFQKLIKYANIKIDFSKIKILSDFELPLRKSIINNFKESELMGCYFHL